MSGKLAWVLIALLGGTVAVGAGCKSELDDKTAAVVGESTGEVRTESDDALKKHEVTVEDSSIAWLGAKVTGDHDGGFKEWEGDVYTKNGEVKKLEFTVQTATIFSDSERLTGHLKTEDFFDVAKYPEATFVSTKIEEKPGYLQLNGTPTQATHEVTGDFTVRGITKSMSFPASISVKEGVFEARTEFTFKRFDFDIAYKGKADDLIRDEVLLKVVLVAPLEPEQS